MSGAVLLHALEPTGRQGEPLVPRLTKRIYRLPDGSLKTEPADHSKWFRAEPIEFDNLLQFAAVLKWLERQPHSCLVRGELIEGTAVSRCRRLKDDDYDDAGRLVAIATLRPAARQWVMIDIDGAAAGAGIDPVHDLEGAAVYLIHLLPREFHDADCYFQFSGSQGVKPGKLSAHLFFWLDRPYTDGELKAWAAPINEAWIVANPGTKPLIDTALFDPIQLHYTAGPLPDPGIPDPLPRRSGFREGAKKTVSLSPSVSSVTSSGAERPRTGKPAKSLEEHFAAIGPGYMWDGIKSAAGALVRWHASEGADLHALVADPAPLVTELMGHVNKAIRDRKEVEPGYRPDRHTSEPSVRKLIVNLLRREIVAEKANPRTGRLNTEEPEPWEAELEPEAAEVELQAAVARFFDRATAHEPRTPGIVELINATAGLGKSVTVLRTIRRAVERGTLRPDPLTGDWDRPVHYLTATIRLCEDLAAKYRAMGGRAKVIRGRTHVDDEHPAPLCALADLVNDAQKAGIHDIERTFCRQSRMNEKTGRWETVSECPRRQECPYFAQFEGTAEVYFMAHERAVTPPAETKAGKPALVVVDENLLNSLIREDAGFTKDELLASAGERGTEAYCAAEIIATAMTTTGNPFTPLLAAGYDARRLRELAAELAEEVEASLGLRPGEDAKTVREKLGKAPGRYAIRVFRRLADEMEACPKRTGPRAVTFERGGRLVRRGEVVITDVYWTQYRQKPHGLRDLPVLLLDATADPDLLRIVFPQLEATRIVARRNADVVQTYGFSASKGKMTGKDAEKHAAEVGVILARMAAKRPGGGLLVTHLDAEANVPLPAGWQSEHFGALRGVDRHKDAAALAVVGRMSPKPSDVERMARALLYDTDEPLETLGKDEDGKAVWYNKVNVGFRMRDGSLRGVPADRHPCPWAERFRRQICEAELEQAMDRLRLVWRDNPALVVLVNEVPLAGVVVDQLENYRALAERQGERGAGGRNRLAIAMERLGGFLPASPKWLAGRFPDLWDTEKAVEMDVSRAQNRLRTEEAENPSNPYKDSYRNSRGFPKPAGGARRATAPEPLLGGSPLRAHRYEYRLPKQRGPTPALYSWKGPAEVRMFLAEHFGDGVRMEAPQLTAVPVSVATEAEVSPFVAAATGTVAPPPPGIAGQPARFGFRRAGSGPRPKPPAEWPSDYRVYRGDRWVSELHGLPLPRYVSAGRGLRNR